MNFSEQAWEEIAPIYAAILNHPFIRELAAGTLSKERFQFYMVQDALYLTGFSRVLSLAAARAPDPDTMMQFDEYARTALTVERALHETFFRQFGIADDVAALQLQRGLPYATVDDDVPHERLDRLSPLYHSINIHEQCRMSPLGQPWPSGLSRKPVAGRTRPPPG